MTTEHLILTKMSMYYYYYFCIYPNCHGEITLDRLYFYLILFVDQIMWSWLGCCYFSLFGQPWEDQNHIIVLKYSALKFKGTVAILFSPSNPSFVCKCRCFWETRDLYCHVGISHNIYSARWSVLQLRLVLPAGHFLPSHSHPLPFFLCSYLPFLFSGFYPHFLLP